MVSCGQNCARPCHIPLKKNCLKKGDGYVYWYVCIWIYESVICNSNMYVKYLIYIYVYIYIYSFLYIYLTVDLGPLYFHIPESISTKVMISSSAVLKRLGLTDVSKDFRWISTFSTLVLDRAGEPGSWKFWMVQIDGNWRFFLYILLKCWFFGGWKKGCVLECESY